MMKNRKLAILLLLCFCIALVSTVSAGEKIGASAVTGGCKTSELYLCNGNGCTCEKDVSGETIEAVKASTGVLVEKGYTKEVIYLTIFTKASEWKYTSDTKSVEQLSGKMLSNAYAYESVRKEMEKKDVMSRIRTFFFGYNKDDLEYLEGIVEENGQALQELKKLTTKCAWCQGTKEEDEFISEINGQLQAAQENREKEFLEMEKKGLLIKLVN